MKSKLEDLLNKRILNLAPVSGGCIAQSYRVSCEDGTQFFVKTHNQDSPRLFACEAHGLSELAKAEAVLVPLPIGNSKDFLILPFIETSSPKSGFWREFGIQLAHLHKYKADEYGFYEDNFIGSTPQSNRPHKSWLDFFWQERLLVQLHLLEQNGLADNEIRQGMKRLESRLPQLLGEPEFPSLLHGDLWSGNFMCTAANDPVLIDPAVYYGDREADLAMTRLFGGFHGDFYSGYEEVFPLREGSEDRVDLYNLYHVLNHLNLFGSNYYGQAVNLLGKL